LSEEKQLNRQLFCAIAEMKETIFGRTGKKLTGSRYQQNVSGVAVV